MHDCSLEETLKRHFPINIAQTSSSFRFFAQCNEFDVHSVIKNLSTELSTMQGFCANSFMLVLNTHTVKKIIYGLAG